MKTTEASLHSKAASSAMRLVRRGGGDSGGGSSGGSSGGGGADVLQAVGWTERERESHPPPCLQVRHGTLFNACGAKRAREEVRRELLREESKGE